ncbi:glycosyltransferase, partial [Enterococcus faecalis]|nr:glycosyltransferase [Enterococcus faecalis]
MKKKILITTPVYNEANNMRPLYKKLNKTLEKKRNEVDFEILFINDGRKDNTVSEGLS